MNFNIQIEGIDELKKRLNPKFITRAMAATLNDMGGAVKTEMAQQIRATYNITSERIKKGINLKQKANNSQLTAIVSFGEKVPGLQHYKMNIKSAKKTKKGYSPPIISVAIKKQGGRKILRQSFLIPSRTSKEGIPNIFAVGEYRGGRFIRMKGRKPIARLLGPSIKGMFTATGGQKKADQIIHDRAEKAFNRNLQRYLYQEGLKV